MSVSPHQTSWVDNTHHIFWSSHCWTMLGLCTAHCHVPLHSLIKCSEDQNTHHHTSLDLLLLLNSGETHTRLKLAKWKTGLAVTELSRNKARLLGTHCKGLWFYWSHWLGRVLHCPRAGSKLPGFQREVVCWSKWMIVCVCVCQREIMHLCYKGQPCYREIKGEPGNWHMLVRGKTGITQRQNRADQPTSSQMRCTTASFLSYLCRKMKCCRVRRLSPI